eukprot:1246252-Prymnesium_polylepis.1
MRCEYVTGNGRCEVKTTRRAPPPHAGAMLPSLVAGTSAAPAGQPKWLPGHNLGRANVTYVLLARKGLRLS